MSEDLPSARSTSKPLPSFRCRSSTTASGDAARIPRIASCAPSACPTVIAPIDSISAASRSRSSGASSTRKTFMYEYSLEQLLLERVAHELGGAAQIQLLQDARLVRAHGL